MQWNKNTLDLFLQWSIYIKDLPIKNEFLSLFFPQNIGTLLQEKKKKEFQKEPSENKSGFKLM